MIEDIKSFCASIGIEVTDKQIEEWRTRRLASDLYNVTETVAKMCRGEIDGDQYINVAGKTFSIFDRRIVVIDEEEYDDEE